MNDQALDRCRTLVAAVCHLRACRNQARMSQRPTQVKIERARSLGRQTEPMFAKFTPEGVFLLEQTLSVFRKYYSVRPCYMVFHINIRKVKLVGKITRPLLSFYESVYRWLLARRMDPSILRTSEFGTPTVDTDLAMRTIRGAPEV